MGSVELNSQFEVAKIFNSAVASWGIGAAWELGLLDEVRDRKKLHPRNFASQHDLDISSTEGLVSTLVVSNILQRSVGSDMVVAGKLFDEAYRAKSQFHWLSLGSGTLFSRMQYILRNENREGNFYSRDSAAIAYACRDIDGEHFGPAFEAAMSRINFKVDCVADLGCGSGERLLQVIDRHPGSTAIGIDLAGATVKFATSEIAKRGYSDRLSFIEGDACALEPRDEFDEVDLLTCFMMGHDFWPRQNCVSTLQKLRKVFPKVRRFILGDSTRILLGIKDSERAVTEANVPLFTLGFELGHAMMNTYLPTIQEWDGVFAEGGWRCIKKHVMPNKFSVVFELEPENGLE